MAHTPRRQAKMAGGGSTPTRDFDQHTQAHEVVERWKRRIVEWNFVVVGVSPDNLGFAVANALATKQPRVLIICGRYKENLVEARGNILARSPLANVQIVILDLASTVSIRRGASEIQEISKGKIHRLINTAKLGPGRFDVTDDGFERRFGVNHLGPFLLVNILLPALLHSKGFTVLLCDMPQSGPIGYCHTDFSGGQEYDAPEAYRQSQMAQRLFAVTTTRRCVHVGFGKVATVDPGLVLTRSHPQRDEKTKRSFIEAYGDLYDSNGEPNWASGLWRTSETAAASILTAALDPVELRGAGHMKDCKLVRRQTTEELVEGWKAWEISNDMLEEIYGGGPWRFPFTPYYKGRLRSVDLAGDGSVTL